MTEKTDARVTLNEGRHPIDWLNPEYYDVAALHEEIKNNITDWPPTPETVEKLSVKYLSA